MKSPYANPGELAWSLAWCAADSIIERANLPKSERALHERATHELAKSFLPAAALVVAGGGDRFDVVDDDAADLDPIFADWARQVVEATRLCLT
jgi:hypothetical protein